MQLHFDYHQSDQDGKWYWALYQGDNIIGQSTDPKDEMFDCFIQIISIIQSLRTQNEIAIIDRSTGFTFHF